ncbi:MAG TPA: RagB/SusD family nutrient uptake outer membrane protein, partial [Bacteroidales bacterium]|nr:RagB/SusD family nutrient uptake outer membrane protein [Bacteroidales bacterium]
MKKIRYIVKLIMVVLLIASQSCSEDFLDEFPSNSQSPDNIKTISDAQIVLNGAYNLLQNNNYWNAKMITYHGVKGDDMQTAEYGRIYIQYSYSFTAEDMEYSGNGRIWAHPYTVIRHVNTILSFIDDIPTVGDAEAEAKLDIKGQCLMIRALAHFDLCRMFGRQYSHDNGTSLGIPIATEILATDAKVPRSTVAQVYAQVINDLNAAIPLLPVTKRLGKVNAWAAKTLLARVYLYMEDNANAYATATDIINNGPYTLMDRADYVDSWANENGSS